MGDGVEVRQPPRRLQPHALPVVAQLRVAAQIGAESAVDRTVGLGRTADLGRAGLGHQHRVSSQLAPVQDARAAAQRILHQTLARSNDHQGQMAARSRGRRRPHQHAEHGFTHLGRQVGGDEIERRAAVTGR